MTPEEHARDYLQRWGSSLEHQYLVALADLTVILREAIEAEREACAAVVEGLSEPGEDKDDQAAEINQVLRQAVEDIRARKS